MWKILIKQSEKRVKIQSTRMSHILLWKFCGFEFSIPISITHKSFTHLKRVHFAVPFFTISGLHSFLISMQSFLSFDSFMPVGQMQLYEPAVFMHCDDFGQRIFSDLHSSMSMQSSFSFSEKPEKQLHLKLPIEFVHC